MEGDNYQYFSKLFPSPSSPPAGEGKITLYERRQILLIESHCTRHSCRQPMAPLDHDSGAQGLSPPFRTDHAKGHESGNVSNQLRLITKIAGTAPAGVNDFSRQKGRMGVGFYLPSI